MVVPNPATLNPYAGISKIQKFLSLTEILKHETSLKAICIIYSAWELEQAP